MLVITFMVREVVISKQTKLQLLAHYNLLHTLAKTEFKQTKKSLVSLN